MNVWRTILVTMLGLVWLAGSAWALDNAHDAPLDRWGAEVKAHPAEPRGMAAFLRAWYLELYASKPQDFTELARWVLASPRSSFELNVHALWALRQDALRHGDPGAWRDYDQRLGLVTRWKVVGPFDNEGGAGEGRSFAPERGYEVNADYQGKERAIRWRDFPPTGESGLVNLGRAMLPNNGATAYAYARVFSPTAQSARAVFSSAGAAKVWVNGTLVLDNDKDRTFSRVQDILPISLRAGVNEILVKTSVREGEFKFRLALLNVSGKGAPKGLVGLRSDTLADEKAPFAARHAFSLSQTPHKPMPNAALLARQRAERTRKADDWWTAAYLVYKYADFAREERLPAQLVEKALEADPDHLDSLLLTHSTVDDPNRAVESLRRAMTVSPHHPEAVRRLAGLMDTGGRTWEAQELLRRALMQHDELFLRLKLSELEARYGETVSRLHLLRKVHQDFPAVRALVPLLAQAYQMVGLDKDAQAVLLAFEEHEKNLIPRFARHYSKAKDEGRREDALQALNTLLDLDPLNVVRYEQKARLLEDLGRRDEALESLRQAVLRLPESPRLLEVLAEFEHRRGNTDEAMALWNHSLDLVPQNPELKKYLALLEENRGAFYDEFTRDALALRDKALADPRPAADVDARVLYRGDTVKVFDNGLSSTANQFIVQPLTEAGLKRYQSVWRYYSPDSQELKVLTARVLKADGRISQNVDRRESSTSQTYKIYYDHRAVRFDFRDARPGDILELYTVTHDIGQRNLFKDYFGRMMHFGDEVPQDEVELNLLLPKGRQVVTNTEHLAAKPEVIDRGDEVLTRFRALNLPAQRREPDMPPWVEVSDFVHVSTFKDYDDIGTWYWNLVKEQFVAKEELRKTARDLVVGLSDDAQKVTAIYDWVVKNTRYVGLEFGIHGFKPYQVNDIFNRRYGDCKDKATLIVAMLKEVGIPANLVILRTSDLGSVGIFPPSLAMFNHAIAYVPSLDWYLDGTAEYSGSHELPGGDHDAQAMIVTPETARPVFLPPQKPEENVNQGLMTITLSNNGDAKVVSESRVMGLGAAGVRRKYQDVDRRREILEKEAASLRSGSTVESFLFSELDNLEQPIRVVTELAVPSYATLEGDTLVIQGAAKPVQALKRMAPLSERRYPVRLSALYTFQMEETIVAPDGAEWTGLPESISLQHDAADFVLTVSREGQTLRMTSTFRVLKRDVSLEQYPAFRAFCQDVDKAQQQQIRLRVKGGEHAGL